MSASAPRTSPAHPKRRSARTKSIGISGTWCDCRNSSRRGSLLDPPPPPPVRPGRGFGAMLVLIDNYDSFTFNLFHDLGGLGADVVVHRNDKVSVDAVIAADPGAIVLSPGPCTPNEAGICLELIAKI